ncbi:hypothetical protein BDR07DRAFT_1379136 [Suillus spraguei]|nr:hypothetical protein BDR07DRAFT_1379136 [Suillus spraguei]
MCAHKERAVNWQRTKGQEYPFLGTEFAVSRVPANSFSEMFRARHVRLAKEVDPQVWILVKMQHATTLGGKNEWGVEAIGKRVKEFHYEQIKITVIVGLGQWGACEHAARIKCQETRNDHWELSVNQLLGSLESVFSSMCDNMSSQGQSQNRQSIIVFMSTREDLTEALNLWSGIAKLSIDKTKRWGGVVGKLTMLVEASLGREETTGLLGNAFGRRNKVSKSCFEVHPIVLHARAARDVRVSMNVHEMFLVRESDPWYDEEASRGVYSRAGIVVCIGLAGRGPNGESVCIASSSSRGWTVRMYGLFYQLLELVVIEMQVIGSIAWTEQQTLWRPFYVYYEIGRDADGTVKPFVALHVLDHLDHSLSNAEDWVLCIHFLETCYSNAVHTVVPSRRVVKCPENWLLLAKYDGMRRSTNGGDGQGWLHFGLICKWSDIAGTPLEHL